MARVTSLIVQTKTGNGQWDATGDTVYFDIGTRQWQLNNTNETNFQRNKVDTFVLQNLGDLDEAHIRKIRVEKAAGNDGWKPEWVKVWVNDPSRAGEPFFFGTINKFIKEGNGTSLKHGPFWEFPDFPEKVAIDSPDVTSLIVKVTTGNQSNSVQTDDYVYFDIGTRAWNLDNPSINDFERGRTDTFVLQDLAGLKISHIKKIGLFKTGENGWFVERIRVWVNDPSATSTPFLDTTVDIWLDGGPDTGNRYGLSWAARNYPQPVPITPATDSRQAVTSLLVETKTADVQWANSNAEIYFNIGTREWRLDNPSRDDFERTRVDSFDLQELGDLRVSDIRKIALRHTGEDGWLPESIKVYVNDPGKSRAPYYEGSIQMWLDGGAGSNLPNQLGPRWEAPDFYLEIPVACHLIVGQNNSSIRSGRSKQASIQLLTNANTDFYRRNAGSSDGIWTQGRLKFRVVSFGDVSVPDTQANSMPDRNNGDFRNLQNIAALNNQGAALNIYFVRRTQTGSNWFVSGGSPACWVMDTRGGQQVNTKNNFDRVVSSLSHEIGHFFGLSHTMDSATRLMWGGGTDGGSELLTTSEVATVYNRAKDLAENIIKTA